MATLERNALPTMLDDTDSIEPKPFVWTKEQYHAMSGMGWFEDVCVELIEGEIILMAAMSSGHFTSVYFTQRVLEQAFGEGVLVVVQSAFDLGPRSEPQPDIQVVLGTTGREYADALPQEALLIVEVSDTTLRSDPTKKASAYARAGIEDYWIVDLKARQIEVCREPQPVADAPFGYRYASVTIVSSEETLSPLAWPNAVIAAVDLLP